MSKSSVGLQKAFSHFRHSLSFCIILVLSLFILPSCRDGKGGSAAKDSPGSTSSADSATKEDTRARQLSPFLPAVDVRILYLENFANDPAAPNDEHEQLKKLLGNGNKEKAAFEFLVTDSNMLGARAVPARRGNRDYVLSDAFPLRMSSQKVTLQQPDTLFLSALQLDNNDQSIVNLLKAKTYDRHDPNRNAGFEYILFVPRVDTVPGSPNYRHLVLDVAKLKPGVPFNKDRLLEFDLLSVANPTPPRQVY